MITLSTRITRFGTATLLRYGDGWAVQFGSHQMHYHSLLSALAGWGSILNAAQS